MRTSSWWGLQIGARASNASTTMSDFKAIIISAYPELADSKFTLLTHSYDSTAVDVDGSIIFKFPRNRIAETALRKEAKILKYVRPLVTLSIPSMELNDGPPLFSRHTKIPGEHLEDFLHLPSQAKQKLGETLGRFYSELHALDTQTMKELGASQLPSFGDADDILARCMPKLPLRLRSEAQEACRRWAVLPPDPYGHIFCFCDGHGWNMAFDQTTSTLNGIYDFADSGIAPLHQEFIYASLTSHELAERIVSSYEQLSGRQLDRRRIGILTGIHRLRELADEEVAENVAERIRQVEAWVEAVQGF